MTSKTTRRKITVIALSTVIFAIFGLLIAEPLNAEYENAVLCSVILGTSLGIYEEFFIQSKHATWLRNLHPILNILISSIILVTLCIAAVMSTIYLIGMWGNFWDVLKHIPKFIWPLFLVCIVTILCLRIFGFIGPHNVLHLITGRYQRPVEEKKVFVFIDLIGSTKITEQLGPIHARELVCQFLIDISRPLTDHSGDVHRYSGDGMIVVWNWDEAFENNNVLCAIEKAHAVIAAKKEWYSSRFHCIPQFRSGVHGGIVITSEQGDLRRSIDYHGVNINLAARLEHKAKELNEETIVSSSIVANLAHADARLSYLSDEIIRGLTAPVSIYSFRPSSDY